MFQLLIVILAISSIENCEKHFWDPRYRHIAALILARGGSKSIPLKNLAKINNKSLLKITLQSVRQVDFSSIWVSTDHLSIFDEAKDFNVHWRSEESASDTAPSLLGVENFLDFHPEVDSVALIQCTSPFIHEKYLLLALREWQRGAECVFSTTRSFKLRWMENKEGEVFPVNFSTKKRPRRQDWSGELVENGMFYFARRKLIDRGYLQSTKCRTVEIPQKHSL